MQIHLLVIDPQNDFCVADDGHGNKGTLVVPNAYDDMKRLADMVYRLSDKLDDIHVTLDSHRRVDISHPLWWKDSSGNPPSPFTILGLHGDKIVKMAPQADGSLLPTPTEFTTKLPSFLSRSKQYLKDLVSGNRYPHCIWPEHCLIGTWGHSVVKELMNAFLHWEEQFATVDYVTKGSNIWTEHFSGVKAEVPDPKDPTTQINTQLITTLEQADMIAIAGEARSHCLKSTVEDIVSSFGDPSYIKKLVLLTDACSDVPGFEHYGKKFLQEMTAKGMGLSTTVDFLK